MLHMMTIITSQAAVFNVRMQFQSVGLLILML